MVAHLSCVPVSNCTAVLHYAGHQ